MQRVDPGPFSGKTFAAAASGALLRLSVLQILANVLSALTGSGMVRPLFCLYTACLLGGIQLISLGVIGQYIGKTYMETKRRPRYIISERTWEDNKRHWIEEK